MTVRDLISAELETGLARLAGTRVLVTIPMRQRVVDHLLRLVPAVPASAAVVLGPDRHVQVRYGSFHADARLHPEATLIPTPVVTLELSSQLVAFALRRLTLPPFVRVSGRDVQIHLAEVPALAALTGLWTHVEQIAFRSLTDGLELSVRLLVRAGALPLPPLRARESAPTGTSRPSTSPLLAWAQSQLDAGLPAFAGARMSATVRAPVGLLNDVLAGALAAAASGEMRSSERVPASTFDVGMVARQIRHARVEAAPGFVTLDVEVGVDG